MDESLRAALREHMRQLGHANLRHGATRPGDPLVSTYRSWQAMKRRCDAPKDTYYARYGGRGISYDPRWAKFDAFLEDMGPRPSGQTLDRIDRDGNYDPGNVRWATHSEQARNRVWDPAPANAANRLAAARRREAGIKVVYGTKTIECMDGCGTTGTVPTTVSRWRCPADRVLARRRFVKEFRDRHRR